MFSLKPVEKELPLGKVDWKPKPLGDTVTGRKVQPGPDIQTIKKTTVAMNNFGVQSQAAAEALAKLDLADIEAKMQAAMGPDIMDKIRRFGLYGGDRTSLATATGSVGQGEYVVPTVKRGLTGPKEIPAAWKAALKRLQFFFPDAVLAGGALRDRDAGKKVKDLDFFIQVPDVGANRQQEIKKILQKDGWEPHLMNAGSYADWFRSNVAAVINAEFKGCPKIQIILLTTGVEAKQLLPEFDFGLNQIMFNGETIQKTFDYDSDFQAKRFRVIGKQTTKMFNRIVGRYARISKRYEGWSFDAGAQLDGYVGGQSIKTMYGV